MDAVASIWLVHGLNGLASASTLFLVAVGLSLIFGVTRVVNFAHGSFFMLGLYVAYSFVDKFAPVVDSYLGFGWGYWLSLPLTALVVACLGALVEVFLLRRLYASQELFLLLATFACVLIIQDTVLWLWGSQDLLGPRAPGLAFSIQVGDQKFPAYDLFLIVMGPLILLLMQFFLHHTQLGLLVRAASHDREMVSALGVPQSYLFTSVFALGCALAGLAGALQLPKEPAHLGLDLSVIGDAFVVVVVGGLGSMTGAFLAAILVGMVKAICIAIGSFEWNDLTFSLSKLTLVAEFIVMAIVLIVRPSGLMGKEIKPYHTHNYSFQMQIPIVHQQWLWIVFLSVLFLLPLWSQPWPYIAIIGIDVLIACLMAASLQWLMGPVGLNSFGHSAWLGVGSYTAALLSLKLSLPMWGALLLAPFMAAVVALVLGWFCIRLSGVYLAMLTLAAGQILWSIAFQWDSLTGGSNGLTGVWPSPMLSDKSNFYMLCLILVSIGVFMLMKLAQSPFGWMLRASRDTDVRAQAIGIPIFKLRWLAFVISAFFAGLAGALFAFSKGSISPDVLSIQKSMDALLMVLLGGIESATGPIWGAWVMTGLQDTLSRNTEYWRAVWGGVMLLLIIAFPQGLATFQNYRWFLLFKRAST